MVLWHLLPSDGMAYSCFTSQVLIWLTKETKFVLVLLCFHTPWPSLQLFSLPAPNPVCFLLTTLPRVVFEYCTVFEIKETSINISYSSSNARLLWLKAAHPTLTKFMFPFMVASQFWFTVTCDELIPPGSSLHQLFQNTVSLLFSVSKWIISRFFLLALNSSMVADFKLSQFFLSNLSLPCTDVPQI